MTPAPQRGALPTAKWMLRSGLWPLATAPGEKRPIGTAWGVTPPTRERLIDTFETHAGAGVGALLGPVAGVVDLETDDLLRAAPLLDQLNLPPTLGWRSARGPHRLYRWNKRLEGLPAVVHIGALEFRIGGEGKQTCSVVPPTRGDDRRRRRWDGQVWEIAPLPDSVLQLLETQSDPKLGRVAFGNLSGHDPDRYAAAAMRYELKAVATAAEGTRNVTLNRSAWSLGTLVGAGLLGADSVRVALLEAALSSGLPEREARATIESGLSAGIRKPRR